MPDNTIGNAGGIALKSFTDAAAQLEGGDRAVRVAGGQVGGMGRLAGALSRAGNNRETMRAFRDALRAEFGATAANSALREVLVGSYNAGKPLTARHIVQVTARARQEMAATAMPEFIAGRVASGTEVTLGEGGHPYTLDGALDAFLESRNLHLDDAGRHFLKDRLARALLLPQAGPRPENMSRRELFRLVQKGEVGNLAFLTRTPPEGGLEDKARLADMLGDKDSILFAARALGRMRGSQGEGPLTRETVWRACFREEPPLDAAGGDFGRNFQERLNVRAAVEEELFPSRPADEKRPPLSTSALRDIWASALPPGIAFDSALLNPENFMIPVRAALSALGDAAAREGRVPSGDEFRAAAREAVARELEAVGRVMREIDALPEAGENPRPGEFTPEHKELMKTAAQKHHLHDLRVLTTLMPAAGEREQSVAVRRAAVPAAPPSLLAAAARDLSARYLRAMRESMGEDGRPTLPEAGMEIMLDLAVGAAGLSRGQIGHLAANLKSAAAENVGGAFLYSFDGSLPNLPEDRKLPLASAYGMMRALRNVSDILANGRAEQDFTPFSDPVPLRLLGGSEGCMDVLAGMAGPGISLGARVLSAHVPPFGEKEWNSLLPIAEKAAQGPNGLYVAHWIASAGEDILAAQARNGGRPLDNAGIWRAVTGLPMPRGVTDADFGERLYGDFSARYLEAMRGVVLGIPDPDDVDILLNERFGALSVGGGLSPRRMLELARPGAVLTLEDIHAEMGMSSLQGYNAGNAYGLVTDFPRRSPAMSMSFTDVQGRGRVINKTTESPGAGPDHPTFRTIIGWVNGLTHGSEAQTARVLQAFSQAPQVTATMYAKALGVPLDANGNYSVSAVEQADGRVLVEIIHDPSRGFEERPQPVYLRQQYSVNPDGTHECTAFELRRTDI
ncbi:MAG: hypothetical protein LBQ63_00520 [Deltaproteobacteria bacterium]|nr:hypothetical protein [Deltaproteobacteria bacterium]